MTFRAPIATAAAIAAIAVAALTALAACNYDSTDVSGDYTGNVTFVATGSSATTPVLDGAQAGSVNVANITDTSIALTLDSGCELTAEQLHEELVGSGGATHRYVFTSETIPSQQTCALMLGDQTVDFASATGELVIDYGGTLSMSLGGMVATPASYLVYTFAGAE